MENIPSITMDFLYIDTVCISVEILHFYIFYEFSKRFLTLEFYILTLLGTSIISLVFLLYTMCFSLKTPLYAFPLLAVLQILLVRKLSVI